jgi:hypothetical protein
MNLSDLKALYIGQVSTEGTCLHRLRAFREVVCEVDTVSTSIPMQKLRNRYVRVLVRKLAQGLIRWSYNAAIKRKVTQNAYDLIWIDKGLGVSNSVLRCMRAQQPDAKIISYSPDDMMNPNNQTQAYLDSLSIYDYHITTKSYNVDELRALGAKAVIYIGNAYAPEVHRPMELSVEEQQALGADVGFIGDYELERVASMDALAAEGIDIVMCCPSLPYGVSAPKHLKIREGYLAADAYAKQICAFKINLCFLRRVNRDLQTTRTIEIPACAGFMLAERTDEQLALFAENEEAAFFDSESELLDQIRKFRDAPAERQRIAASGYQRCLRSGYSNRSRIEMVLHQVFTGQAAG